METLLNTTQRQVSCTNTNKSVILWLIVATTFSNKDQARSNGILFGVMCYCHINSGGTTTVNVDFVALLVSTNQMRRHKNYVQLMLLASIIQMLNSLNICRQQTSYFISVLFLNSVYFIAIRVYRQNVVYFTLAFSVVSATILIGNDFKFTWNSGNPPAVNVDSIYHGLV